LFSASYTTTEREIKEGKFFVGVFLFIISAVATEKLQQHRKFFNNFSTPLSFLSNIYKADVKVHYLSSVKRVEDIDGDIVKVFPVFTLELAFFKQNFFFKALVMRFRHKHG
jgi:hypothetical protein